jgi:hypothetical protein
MFAQRSRLASLALVAAVVFAACGRDSPTDPTESPGTVAGTYTLSTVGGVDVPLQVYEDAEVSLDLVSGSVVLRTDGTFEEVLTFVETENGADPSEMVEQTSGTFTIVGRTITFVTATERWIGVVVDGTLTYNYGAIPFTFER